MEIEEENQKINRVIDKKVVDKKPLNLVKILKRKTNVLSIRLKLRKISFKIKGCSLKDRDFDK